MIVTLIDPYSPDVFFRFWFKPLFLFPRFFDHTKALVATKATCVCPWCLPDETPQCPGNRERRASLGWKAQIISPVFILLMLPTAWR